MAFNDLLVSRLMWVEGFLLDVAIASVFLKLLDAFTSSREDVRKQYFDFDARILWPESALDHGVYAWIVLYCRRRRVQCGRSYPAEDLSGWSRVAGSGRCPSRFWPLTNHP